jgi:hypothetical protein
MERGPTPSVVPSAAPSRSVSRPSSLISVEQDRTVKPAVRDAAASNCGSLALALKLAVHFLQIPAAIRRSSSHIAKAEWTPGALLQVERHR